MVREAETASKRGGGVRRWFARHVLALVMAAAALPALAAPAAETATEAPTVVKLAHLPPPDVVANASVADPDYVIGALDLLTIKIYPDVGLGGDVQVDDKGRIEMPLIGSVAAAGKTPHQLGVDIAAGLGAKYLEAPSVAVQVKTSATQKYTVTGAVTKPGVFDLSGQMTLMQAVATAGGVAALANNRNIVIFRIIQRKRAAAVISLEDVEKGKVDDPIIYAGDIILVTKSSGKELFQNLLKATPLFFFLTPLGI
jgi:polysaccharide export outer membrane protein